jgi:hypothetical protein
VEAGERGLVRVTRYHTPQGTRWKEPSGPDASLGLAPSCTSGRSRRPSIADVTIARRGRTDVGPPLDLDFVNSTGDGGEGQSLPSDFAGPRPQATNLAEIPDQLTHDLHGRYTLEREPGRGGMAVVCLAQDLMQGRAVALKMLRPEWGLV